MWESYLTAPLSCQKYLFLREHQYRRQEAGSLFIIKSQPLSPRGPYCYGEKKKEEEEEVTCFPNIDVELGSEKEMESGLIQWAERSTGAVVLNVSVPAAEAL